MAEYYPLLAKAVSALDLDATEARHALYDRARKALIGQLRAATPSLSDAHIDSESRALDLAVARIEAEIAVRAAIRGMAPITPAPFYPPQPPPLPQAAFEMPAMAPAAPESRLAPPPPRMASPQPARPSYIPTPPVRPAAPTITAVAPPAQQPADEEELSLAAAVRPSADRQPPAAQSKPPRRELLRPPAPVKAEQRARKSMRGLIVTLAILAVVGVVAGAAWWLKQSQDELARNARTPTPVATEETQQQQGKSGERIGAKSPAPAPQAPVPAPGGQVAETPISPVKVTTTTIRPGPPQVAPANAIPEPDGAVQPGIAVAQRAAILVDAPEEASRIKTYAGTVVWRVEQVKRDGKPAAAMLRADIDIPSAKAQIQMTLQKNLDAALPASHMIELRFIPAPGSELPGVRSILVPEMRKEESPTGEPLTGAPVPVVDNFFIVGLAKGEAESAHNIELLSGRNWIDVQLQLSNKKNAKLTFEKGPPGERALNEALAAWK